MGMQNQIEDTTNLISEIKELIQNPSVLKKYTLLSNYSKPTNLRERLNKNLKTNLPVYILFSGLFSIIFCIRNLSCLFFASSWFTYLLMVFNNETIKINDYEITANQILIATICSNFCYLF